MSDRVNLFMALVSVGLAVTMAVMFWRNVCLRWIDQAAGKDERVKTLADLWGEAVLFLRCHRWLLLLPVGVAAFEAVTNGVMRAITMRAYGYNGSNMAGSPGRSWWSTLVTNFTQWWPTRLSNAACEGLSAGVLFSSQNENGWLALIVLLVGGGILIGRSRKWRDVAVWNLALAFSLIGIVLQVLAARSHPQTPAPMWYTYVPLISYPMLVAVTGAPVLLLLRGLLRGERVSLSALTDAVASFWPKWFCLAFIIQLPWQLGALASLLVPYSSRWHGAAMTGWRIAIWVSAFFTLAMRFAPYALAARDCSVPDAARHSLEVWRHRWREVLFLLLPLWAIGFVSNLLIETLDVLGRSLSQLVWQQFLTGLHDCLWLLFVLFAEVVCFQWYTLHTAIEEATPYQVFEGQSMDGTSL